MRKFCFILVVRGGLSLTLFPSMTRSASRGSLTDSLEDYWPSSTPAKTVHQRPSTLAALTSHSHTSRASLFSWH